MRLSGVADLPLHEGHVPQWLMKKMKFLSSSIVKVMVEELGVLEVLRRLADPYWFQAFGCVLGFDWHSSGLTTVVTGALREAVRLETHGIGVVGGKSIMALRVPEMIKQMNLEDDLKSKLIRVSKLSAKVDNAVLQDGYNIYHHVIVFTEKGNWTVIQQGMNLENKYARRYHWFGENVSSFVEEPHSGIAGDRKEEMVLNMVSKKSSEARKASVDLASEKPSRLARLVNLTLNKQETLTRWIEREEETVKIPAYLCMPLKINWNALKKAYDLKPSNYEELIQIEGMGPATLRALALISTLIYGVEIDWRDPVKFTFAHGGKDGVPYPVSRKRMEESIKFLTSILESAEIEREEKLKALRRLYNLEKNSYGEDQDI
ncbi:MAG: DUF763 domain-containing protein [Aigarchaeota archaeon]|nr:DUF763 domain-containing protein [Candidatus Geocrenenecus dongiae]